MVPKPVKAVVFLFPITQSLEAKRKEEDKQINSSAQKDVDPTVVFIKQTVSKIFRSCDLSLKNLEFRCRLATHVERSVSSTL